MALPNVSSDCKKRKMELDRLSNLPSDVTGNILSYMPLKEAVRTSALSKIWRLRWTTLPSLVFDERIRPIDDLVSIVNQVFIQHDGPVDTFNCRLSVPESIDGGALSRWFLHLSRKSIKKLILNIGGRMNPSVSSNSHLFSCQYLTHLGLSNCSLELPSMFKGFTLLKGLDFQNVIMGFMAKEKLEQLILLSPLLETVTICGAVDVSDLKVDAPNIQFLKLGDFQDVQLTNTSNLVHVSLDRTFGRKKNSSSKLLNFIVKLPRIERLAIEGCMLDYCVGSLPEELPEPCIRLNSLSMSICLNRILEENLAAMFLLRSSTALQELEISIHQKHQVTAGGATYWLNDTQNCEFRQLRFVKVTGCIGVKAEIDFLTFLFSSSPVLQELHILFEEHEYERRKRRRRLESLDRDAAAIGEQKFTQLRVIKVTGFSGDADEVSLIRFLLTSSTMVERITLQPASAKVSWNLSKLLAETKCNLVHADLKFLDPLIPLKQDSDRYYSRL